MSHATTPVRGAPGDAALLSTAISRITVSPTADLHGVASQNPLCNDVLAAVDAADEHVSTMTNHDRAETP